MPLLYSSHIAAGVNNNKVLLSEETRKASVDCLPDQELVIQATLNNPFWEASLSNLVCLFETNVSSSITS